MEICIIKICVHSRRNVRACIVAGGPPALKTKFIPQTYSARTRNEEVFRKVTKVYRLRNVGRRKGVTRRMLEFSSFLNKRAGGYALLSL